MAPREQILSIAARLFFTQGYTQTGINQLIEASEVAKRTFYHHFSSKEELGVAYLDFAAAQWLASLRVSVRGRRSPQGVVRGLFEHVERFALETQFRGCGVLNMASEFADAESEVRARVTVHKDAQRALMRELFAQVGTGPARADAVHVLLEGAIASAAGHRDVWPIRAAAQAAEAVLSGVSCTPSKEPTCRYRVRSPSSNPGIWSPKGTPPKPMP
jgi:AcrR family transcriptional regulator